MSWTPFRKIAAFPWPDTLKGCRHGGSVVPPLLGADLDIGRADEVIAQVGLPLHTESVVEFSPLGSLTGFAIVHDVLGAGVQLLLYGASILAFAIIRILQLRPPAARTHRPPIALTRSRPPRLRTPTSSAPAEQQRI